jgi:hypothetical protein
VACEHVPREVLLSAVTYAASLVSGAGTQQAHDPERKVRAFCFLLTLPLYP